MTSSPLCGVLPSARGLSAVDPHRVVLAQRSQAIQRVCVQSHCGPFVPSAAPGCFSPRPRTAKPAPWKFLCAWPGYVPVMTSSTKMGVFLGSVALLAGCNGEAGDTGPADDASADIDGVESASADPDPTKLCRDLLDDDAVAAFGWRPGDPAGESAGRCERSGGGNVVTVGERPDLDSSHEADQAQTAHDSACAALASDSGGVLDAETTWLDPTTACLKEFAPGKETGVARMLVLTEQSAIVEIQVVAHDATTRSELRKGLAALVDGVEATW